MAFSLFYFVFLYILLNMDAAILVSYLCLDKSSPHRLLLPPLSYRKKILLIFLLLTFLSL